MNDRLARKGARHVIAATLFACFLLVVFVSVGTEASGDVALAAAAADDEGLLESLFEPIVSHQSGNDYTWLDERGEVITITAIAPTAGDTYIDGDNRLYEVLSVDETRTATAAYRETIELPKLYAQTGSPSSGVFSMFRRGVLQAASDAQDQVIGIYHSHNAESYVGSSGEEFIEPHGEIVDVGAALAKALEEKGLTVVHSDASHLPHDGGAYQRSRGTVRELLEDDAVALLDVHRDAISADEYLTEVDGEEMTKIRLVVGRQNPNREANLELAQRIKAIADEQHPGLVKGIFHAHGNYNQDVGPRTILLEFGTHETSAQQAAKSAELFADVYPAAAGLTSGSAASADRQLGGAGFRSAFWFALLAAAVLFGYLWINEGSPQAAWRRITTFFQRESGKLKTGPNEGGGDGP